MNHRRLATPGALLIFAGAFLLYWGLREFGIVSKPGTATAGTSGGSGSSTAMA